MKETVNTPEEKIAQLEERIKSLEHVNEIFYKQLKEKEQPLSAIQLILNNNKS